MVKILKKILKDGDQQFTEVNELISNAWLQYTNVGKEDILTILKLCPEIEYEDIDDIFDEFEIPRIEKHQNTYVIILRTPQQKKLYSQSNTQTFTIILNPSYIITLSPGTEDFMNKIYSSKDLYTSQKIKFIIKLLTLISDEYNSLIRQYSISVRKLQYSKNEINSKEISNLIMIEEILSEYLTALIPIKSIAYNILDGKYFKLYEDDMDLLEDMYNSIDQATSTCELIVNNIKSLRDNYQVIFSNSLNNKINFLTVITLALTIPNVVTSFYGMNIPLPFQETHFLAYLLIILSSITIFIVFIVLKKNKVF